MTGNGPKPVKCPIGPWAREVRWAKEDPRIGPMAGESRRHGRYRHIEETIIGMMRWHIQMGTKIAKRE
jgi:hypothetical protein